MHNKVAMEVPIPTLPKGPQKAVYSNKPVKGKKKPPCCNQIKKKKTEREVNSGGKTHCENYGSRLKNPKLD